MKRVFALLHKPGFWSVSSDALCGVFETEHDALEALKAEQRNLRRPYVKAYDLVSTEEWNKRKRSIVSIDSDLGGVDGPYDHEKRPRPAYGPGTSRSRGRGYR